MSFDYTSVHTRQLLDEPTHQILYASLSGPTSTLLETLVHSLQIRRNTIKCIGKFTQSHEVRSTTQNSRFISGRSNS
jgi:hypothetical protein